MYNRILKRPMFKRGGSSYEAQGTGITSPYDTPRRGYAHGVTQEEINERRANLYQDPRSDWSYAAEGFSSLANPYKKSGEAKTIGEMLYEGAHDVRGSKAEGRGLEQAAELANIQSDEDILRSEEKFERDKDLIDRQVKSQLQKDYSIKRQVLDLTKILNKQAENTAYEGAEFINDGFAQSVAKGTVEINESDYQAMVVPMSALKKVDGIWKIDKNILAAGMVYWNPINQQWLIVKNARTKDATPIHYSSYQEAKAELNISTVKKDEKKLTSSDSDASDTEIKNNEIKMKITANLKDVELTDAVVMDEAAKAGIKLVSSKDFPTKGKAWKHYLAENEMTLEQFKRILYEKKMSDSYASMTHDRGVGKVIDEVTEEIQVAETLATGGRAGYALGSPEPQGEEVEPDTDDLNELTSWWKSEVENSFNS